MVRPPSEQEERPAKEATFLPLSMIEGESETRVEQRAALPLSLPRPLISSLSFC